MLNSERQRSNLITNDEWLVAVFVSRKGESRIKWIFGLHRFFYSLLKHFVEVCNMENYCVSLDL